MDGIENILKLFGIETPDIEEKKLNNGAFIPSGLKVLKYYGDNLLEILEIENQTFYMMEYTNFIRIFKVLGFDESKLKMTESIILNGDYIIIDFNRLEVGMRIFEKAKSPVSAYMSNAIENYGDIILDMQEEDPMNINLKH